MYKIGDVLQLVQDGNIHGTLYIQKIDELSLVTFSYGTTEYTFTESWMKLNTVKIGSIGYLYGV
jgi:hypothetical protein